MGIVAGHVIEFFARHKSDSYSLPPALIDDVLQAEVVALLCDSDPGKGASACFQSFCNGIDAVNVIHVLVV